MVGNGLEPPCNAARMAEGLKPGVKDSIKPMVPATWGAAKLVPKDAS